MLIHGLPFRQSPYILYALSFSSRSNRCLQWRHL
ncbi:hypothetical protein vBEcoMWL3_gp077 [Escherichia phage vB_EcoM_WL-3]|nr:hypothetical protein vBEcoMWL3_gp077 [Escherichia phage vB_EcoM_WL-3]